ncbi:MAG: 1-(5-phosphoribosyl)-5-((5-phosphoribosylamino)methylideneamino)imidazole-4-carboxamide isomerase [Spirochaetales bacterium]|nr:1-(5-phosphoribosyl)-5-((5-phosphoribosylamino)methylideneamino)imidazole-4-carboxamide isomerase [Spirochaetales bacterium]
MTIIPAIDMLDGKVVRLLHGRYDAVTEYGTDPVDSAKALADVGAMRIHLVDLNAARAKADGSDRDLVRSNRKIMEKIRAQVGVTLEVGGGIRTREDAHELVDRGIDRLILGTSFAKNPALAAQWTQEFGPRFIAGIDARDGRVQVAGWESEAGPGGLADTELATQAREQGIVAIVYTNIAQDGTLAGPDLVRTQEIARVSGLPVIISGGIGTDAHIHEVITKEKARQTDEHTPGEIVGIITGKAYYEGKIDLPDLFKTYPQIQGAW